MTVLSCMVRQVWQTKEICNVLWFNQDNTSEGGIQNTVDQLGAAWVAELQPLLSTQWEGTSMLVRVFNGGGAFSVPYVPASWPIVGAVNAADLPRNVALTLSFGADAPRPNRGRMFTGGFTESGWSDGVWEATYLDAIDDFAILLNEFEDTTWCIARPNYVANTAIFNPVTTWTTPTKPGSQRNRR